MLRQGLVHRLLETERTARICALMGALAIACSSILVKLSHASPSTAAIFRCAYVVPVLLVLAVGEDRRYGARSWHDRRAAIAAGVFMAIDLVLWHHSIDDVGAGLATVLANIQVILVPLVAWLLLMIQPIGSMVLGALIFGESPSALQLLGVLVVLGAVLYATRRRALSGTGPATAPEATV